MAEEIKASKPTDKSVILRCHGPSSRGIIFTVVEAEKHDQPNAGHRFKSLEEAFEKIRSLLASILPNSPNKLKGSQND